MHKDSKIVSFGSEAREKLLKGVNIIGDAVGETIGPFGRNVVIERKWRWPEVTNDGITVANQIICADPTENLGAKLVIQASQETNDEVGDGTSSTVVLTQALVKEAFKRMNMGILSSNSHAVSIKNEILSLRDKAIEALKKLAKAAKTKADLYKIAFASIENEEHAKTVSEIVHKVGQQGFVYVEEGFGHSVETEIVEGMNFPGGYIAPFMANNEKKQAIHENIKILITNIEVNDPALLKGVLDDMTMMRNQDGNRVRLVVFAPKFGKDVASSIFYTQQHTAQNGIQFQVLAVKYPSLTDDQVEDVAYYTGARFIDYNKQHKLEDVRINDLGLAKKVIATNDDCYILGGNGDKKLLADRVEKLKKHLEIEVVDVMKKKIERRIASLSTGIGIIRVGAKSDPERLYLKRKYDDAVSATKAALEEGYVKGGGLALKEISEQFKGTILEEPLQAPYKKIQENAGGKLEIPDDIIDPTKVVRVSLEKACSVAAQIITTGVTIAEKTDDIGEQLGNFLRNAQEPKE